MSDFSHHISCTNGPVLNYDRSIYPCLWWHLIERWSDRKSGVAVVFVPDFEIWKWEGEWNWEGHGQVLCPDSVSSFLFNSDNHTQQPQPSYRYVTLPWSSLLDSLQVDNNSPFVFMTLSLIIFTRIIDWLQTDLYSRKIDLYRTFKISVFIFFL